MRYIKKNITYITLLVIGTMAAMYLLVNKKTELPIFNPIDFNPELVDATIQGINENHTVSDFKLINQNGKVITQSDYNDKIYVTDFFFTRCPSICPIMSTNMEKLQNTFRKENEVMFL
ncbi:MAG: SCO family protein, partial [Maribacter sp.]|nr:SCO family protein [Maribacter sp.]